ncbi:ABC transporter permease [Microbacterium sp. 2FI]|uniref:ABC transporter permease n=1 Tax=Microbacterium sp. 2FI TaxID=2502193 RepID=UPI0010F82AAF|nr:ABC transporter permease [Microbacterium sp. 2FI]
MTTTTTILTASGPRVERRGLAAWLVGLSPRGKALVFAGEFVIFLLIWELVVGVLGWINPVFLPPPSAIAQGFVEIVANGSLAVNAVYSLQAWITGFTIAVVIGIPLGLLMGSSLPVDRVVGPIAWTIYATPTIAYQPLSKAWFGFGMGPVIFLVAISAVFPILLNISAGMRTTSPSILRAGRVYGASRMDLYRKVFLPSTVPFLFAGLRQAVVLATIGMVVAELTGSPTGMGALIIRSTNTYQTDQAFAAIAVVVLWSVGMTQVVTLIERRLAPWTRKGRK